MRAKHVNENEIIVPKNHRDILTEKFQDYSWELGNMLISELKNMSKKGVFIKDNKEFIEKMLKNLFSDQIERALDEVVDVE